MKYYYGIPDTGEIRRGSYALFYYSTAKKVLVKDECSCNCVLWWTTTKYKYKTFLICTDTKVKLKTVQPFISIMSVVG